MIIDNKLSASSFPLKGTLADALLTMKIPVGILEGEDFILTAANTSFVQIWENSDGIFGRKITELLSADDRFLDDLKDLVKNGGSVSLSEIKHPSAEAYFDYYFSSINDAEGTVTGILVIATDVSAKLAAEKKLKELEEKSRSHEQRTAVHSSAATAPQPDLPDATELTQRLDIALNAGKLGYYELDLRSGLINATPQFKTNLGLLPDAEPNQQEVFEAILPEYIPNIKEVLQVAFASRKPYQVVFEMRWPDNSIHWIKSTGFTRFDEEGKPMMLLGVAADVTDAMKAEDKQSMLAAIVNTSDDTIVSKTLQGIITSWNKAAERMFGYTEEEAIGQHISILIPPERIQEEELIIGNIARGKKVDHFETVRITKDGRRIPISLSVSPIKDRNGKIIGASKIARDISVQKDAQRAAEKYTESLEVINSVGKSISEELNVNRILEKVTEATTQVTGASFGVFFYHTTDDLGDTCTLYSSSGAKKEAFEKSGLKKASSVFQPVFAGEGTFRTDDLTTDSRINLLHSSLPDEFPAIKSFLTVPISDASGAETGRLFFGHPEAGKFTKDHENIVAAIGQQAAIGLDNAQLYEEVKILNSKKDEFIGLASHELKTPLTSLSGYLQILQREQKDDKTRGFVAKTIQQVKKLSSLVSDLLDISKIEAGKLLLSKEDFDIREIVDDSIELIQLSHLTHQVKLQTSIEHLKINGDRQRLEQVLINLLTNAIKYSPHTSQIELLLNSEGNEVKIGVRDSGIGIENDKLSHIFSRFYRVEGNPNIAGLGIGLYLSKEIVDRHEGKIWAESEPGKGSTFWLSLPIHASKIAGAGI